VRVDRARVGEPFWLAFGQGWSDGWQATIDGTDLGTPALVDGFANGWLIDPDEATFEVALRFTPQRRVDIALWGSLIAALVCVGLVVHRPRGTAGATVAAPSEPGGAGLPEALTVDATAGRPDPVLPVPRAIAVGGALALLGAAVATPAVGLLTGALAVVVARRALPRWLTALAAPAAMAASAGYVIVTVVRHHIAPGLEWPLEVHRAHPIAWLAILALVVDATVVGLRGHRRR
jgi:arabinofuranan 3-O-arabinosyltransferase